jgi:hypothetical protein
MRRAVSGYTGLGRLRAFELSWPTFDGDFGASCAGDDGCGGCFDVGVEAGGEFVSGFLTVAVVVVVVSGAGVGAGVRVGFGSLAASPDGSASGVGFGAGGDSDFNSACRGGDSLICGDTPGSALVAVFDALTSGGRTKGLTRTSASARAGASPLVSGFMFLLPCAGPPNLMVEREALLLANSRGAESDASDGEALDMDEPSVSLAFTKRSGASDDDKCCPLTRG